jgi:UDP-N-acetylmuramate: L-alanyl-gamma-D-glutamyl-meso-diaminopimelate ligase
MNTTPLSATSDPSSSITAAHVVLNNLEFDHADIFADLAAIETQFHHLVRTLPQSGLIVSNAAEASLERVLQRGCWTPVERFNDPAGYRVTGDDARGELAFYGPDGLIGRSAWNFPASTTGPMPALPCSPPAMSACPSCKAWMRSPASRTSSGAWKCAAWCAASRCTTISPTTRPPSPQRWPACAARSAMPASWPCWNPLQHDEAGHHEAQLPDSLREVDAAFCYAGNLGWDAREALAPMGERAVVEDDIERLVDQVSLTAQPGDHILVMSNGGFGGIHGKLLNALAA